MRAVRRCALLLVVGSWLTLLDGCSHGAGGPGPQAREEGPPPTLESEIYLLADTYRIEADGGVLHLRIRSTFADVTGFGIGATLDRWDGSGWSHSRDVVMGLEMWGPDSVGTLLRPGDSAGPVPMIGLTASADQDGPPELLRITGLDDGWYRLCQPGTRQYPGLPDLARTACVQFQVLQHAAN